MIADDLTGACDAGVAFSPAYVVLREPWPPDAAALVFSTASRNDPPDVAAAKVRALRQHLPSAPILFKKIDSVLRGNVRAELDAMAAPGAVVCPAFPEQGRTVKNGVALPAGVDLRALLPGVCTPDAETQQDLHRIAAAGAPLFVGAAGLARAVGRVPKRITSLGGLGAAPLVAIGSTHEATLAQVEMLRATPGLTYDLRIIDMAAPGFELPSPQRQIPPAMFLCGGDTAAFVLDRLGAEGILLEGEIQPGVPFGRIVGGRAAGAAVVTKSGGFGGPDTLVHAVRILSS
jgi:uncharacterized protein YgbK (DUF1537 family)